MGQNTVFRFVRDHKFSYIAGVLFMLLASYVQTLFPDVLGRTVDILKVRHFSSAAVYRNIVYILLIAVGTFVFTYVWRNLIIGNARQMECDLREQLFLHFQELSPEFYSTKKTGDLIAYAINDINAVRMTFGPALAMSINGVVVCVISIWSMARAVNWQLTMLALLPVPVMVAIMVRVGQLVKRRFRRVQETFAAISDRVNENINGSRVIKAYAQEDAEVERFEALNSRMRDTNLRMVRASSVLSPLIELCFTVSFSLNLIIGGGLVLRGHISLGNFVAFNGYLTMILAPILSIGRVITIFQRGMASLGRLNDIFGVPPRLRDTGRIRRLPPDYAVRIRDLSFSYPGAADESLRHVSLTIPRGHTLGIIGRTGAGKSTLCSLLLKLYNVEDGKILFGDTDINELRLTALRDSFGFVPQDNFLFHATVAANIRFFRDDYTDAQVRQAARDSCIEQSILELPGGFDTVLGERGVNLSGGQKQRIAIARALIRDPEILVLDDSLSAVDTVTESAILENLQRVRRGKTTIIVASRISAVMHSDEIIVLDKGEIRQRGSHAQLLQEGGLYREIYDYQYRSEDAGRAS